MGKPVKPIKSVKQAKPVKKKKEESFFIVLLKKRDILFASWRIDASKWKKRIEAAEADPLKKEYLFIDVLSIENGKYKKIDSIPVHGLENNWHIFVKKEYSGKRVVLNLSYCDKKGTFYDILISKEIDIPLSIEDIESAQSQSQLDEEKILLELSEIKLAGVSGSESTSW